MSALAGQRVIVTRAAHQAEELAEPLRRLGADVILLPVIAICAPADPRPLRAAAERLGRYDWVVFTSVNAVTAIEQELAPGVAPPRARIAAVGNATRRAVEKLGWKVDVVPENFVAEALAEEVPQESLRGHRVLLASAAVTRDVLPQALMDKGAIVDVVEAYRNVLPDEAIALAAQIFSRSPKPDWVTFTSSSAVDNLVKLAGADRLRGLKIACIGPVTAASVHRHGLQVDVQPDEHSVTALVEAIVNATNYH